MKLLSVFMIVIILLLPVTVRADDNVLGYNTDELIKSLPDEAVSALSNIGISSPDVSELKNLSFDKVLNEITKMAAEKSASPLKTLAVLIAVMLLCSLLYSFKNSAKTSAARTVLSVCATLCITLAVSMPVVSLIENSSKIIKAAADFTLVYIPAIVFIVSASGRAVSAASYYGLTVGMGQFVSRASATVIAPFLKLFLALGISSAVSPNINLSGIMRFLSKAIRWILGIVTTLFSAFLTVKQIITTGLDSVSERAVKFSLSSFVPVCGAALSEAYKGVENSVGLLKSGVGVLALIAVAVMFLPIILECLLWLFSIWAARSVGELLNLSEPCEILETMSMVVSTIMAVVLSVAVVFIISTAVVLMSGGAS